ncbi:hypothetical protein LIER_14540 [Lithospermum erythrorhizon]|uniref:DUF4283 domain-containing protein n=1 Tax=Lithospermum erythrorhizon TaxID=34254 RepID=A0AAV3Q1S7_LITER
MEAEIIKNLQACQLSVKEEAVTLVNEEDMAVGRHKSMSKAWNMKEIKVERIDTNLSHVFFPSSKEMQRVLSGGPWCFENNVLLMRPWEMGKRPQELMFTHCPFWVHVRGLPPECYTSVVASKLSRVFKDCTVVELREKELDGKWFFRLRVKVDVTISLRRLINLKCGAGTITGLLSYERLPNLCFRSGLLGHLIKECTTNPEERKRDVQYGLWMKSVGEKSRIVQRIKEHGLQDGGTM